MAGLLGLATSATAASEHDASRIVGGAPATIAGSPWQVALARSGPGSAFSRQFCGGTLLAPTIVLTAAQCVHDGGDGYDPPASLEVISGRTTLSSAEGQVIKVAAIHHPVSGPGGAPAFESTTGPDIGPDLFDPVGYAWDVALLELATPSSSPAIQIAGADEAPASAIARSALTGGWGLTTPAGNGAQPADQLQTVELTMLADSACEDYFGWDPVLMVCAGGPNGAAGRGTCIGDAGGPLVVPVELGAGVGVRLVGSASFHFVGCAQNIPDGFARLAADPIRSAVAVAVQELAGVAAVGSGGRPLEPPRAKIAKHPRKRTAQRKASFKLAANEPATFACKLDRSRFRACEARFKLRVGRGRHRLRVRATDALGQVDPTPDSFRWKVGGRR